MSSAPGEMDGSMFVFYSYNRGHLVFYRYCMDWPGDAVSPSKEAFTIL